MGTHPIFESDFDCLTEWLAKTYKFYLANALAFSSSSLLPLVLLPSWSLEQTATLISALDSLSVLQLVFSPLPTSLSLLVSLVDLNGISFHSTGWVNTWELSSLPLLSSEPTLMPSITTIQTTLFPAKSILQLQLLVSLLLIHMDQKSQMAFASWIKLSELQFLFSQSWQLPIKRIRSPMVLLQFSLV